jgi:hypothetical protein
MLPFPPRVVKKKEALEKRGLEKRGLKLREALNYERP